MNKTPTNRIIIIVAALLVVGAIGVGIYFGLQNAKQSIIPGQSSSGTFPTGGANQAAGGQVGSGSKANQSGSLTAEEAQTQKNNLFQLTTNPAAAFWVVSSTAPSLSGIIRAGVYYLNSKGDVVQIQDVGKEQTVTGSSFGTPLRLWQNRDGSYVVVYFDSGTYALFTLATKAWRALPDGTTGVAFSPDGKKLALAKESNGRTTLSSMTLGAARQTITTITSLALVDVVLWWPSPNRLFLVSRPASGVDGQAWYVDVQTKSLNYFSHGDGLQLFFSQASPYAAAQLVVGPDGSTAQMTFLDASGSALSTMQFSTVADKCVFAMNGTQVFCALPRENDGGAHISLLDDYLQGGVYFHDSLYRISGKDFSAVTPLLTASDVNFDMVNFWATPTQLFFMNRLDHTLYLYNLATS